MEADLVADNHYLPTLMVLLDQARTSIDILAFSFAIGTTGGSIARTSAPFEIAEKLVELKKRYKSKISIRLYIEGVRETSDRNRLTAAYLKKHGIEVKYGSTHAKGFCVDGKYVLFGSTNLTNQSILKNNEMNLGFADPAAVSGFQLYFAHLWEGGEHGGTKLPPPMLADGDFKDEIISMINRAQARIDFSIYFFHHAEIEEALIWAHERGVKIRGFFHNHKSFALSFVRKTRATAERLSKTGISDLQFGPTHLFTHSKFLVKDRREIALGTGNWLVEDVEVHPQLYIHFENPALARKIASHLGKQIRRAGEKA